MKDPELKRLAKMFLLGAFIGSLVFSIGMYIESNSLLQGVGPPMIIVGSVTCFLGLFASVVSIVAYFDS